jgi:hypothetical protein
MKQILFLLAAILTFAHSSSVNIISGSINSGPVTISDVDIIGGTLQVFGEFNVENITATYLEIFDISTKRINTDVINTIDVHAIEGIHGQYVTTQLLYTDFLIFGDHSNVVTIVASTFLNSSFQITIPNVGANSEFVLTNGAQSINGIKTFNSGVKFGASQSLLNIYQEELFYTQFKWGNDPDTNITLGIPLTRVGRVVTLVIPGFNYDLNGGVDNVIVSLDALPSGFRPSHEIATIIPSK